MQPDKHEKSPYQKTASAITAKHRIHRQQYLRYWKLSETYLADTFLCPFFSVYFGQYNMCIYIVSTGLIIKAKGLGALFPMPQEQSL